MPRKRGSPKETVTLRLEPAYRAMLRENAKQRKTSVTKLLTSILTVYFDAWQRSQEGQVLNQKVSNQMLEQWSQE